MQKLLPYILVAVILVVPCYLTMAFITLEWNLLEWLELHRAAMTGLWLGVLAWLSLDA